MVDETPDKIPGVNDADLKSVTRELVSAPDLRGDAVERFYNQVLGLAERRAQTQWTNENDADMAVFVLSKYPRLYGEKYSGKRVADLVATKEPLLGKIHFLNGDASQGYAASIPSNDVGQVFEWLEAQEFKDAPMVFLYRSQLLLIERAAGVLGEKTREETVRNIPPTASVAELNSALERFHQRGILTPTVCPPGVWKKGGAGKYHPGNDPEKSIQAKLRTFLDGWFKGAAVPDVEDPGVMGRIDIRLLVPGSTGEGLTYWVVIELKVVKSFRFSPGKSAPPSVTSQENADAVSEGLRQAHAFGVERHCSPGYLEVFDMRKDKSDEITGHTDVVAQLLKLTPKPVVNVRSMFGSAGDARKAGHTYAA